MSTSTETPNNATKTANPADLDGGLNTPNVPFTVNGWEIDSFPPMINSYGGYDSNQNYPAQALPVGIPGSASLLAPNSVTPAFANGQMDGPLGLNRCTGVVTVQDNFTCWEVAGGAHIHLYAPSPGSLDVNLNFLMKVKDQGAASKCSMSIWINGQAFSCNPTSAQVSTNTDWHVQTLPIPAGMLHGGWNGNNHIKIEPIDSGAYIRSVNLTSQKTVSTAAHYFWKNVAHDVVAPGPGNSLSTSVAVGVTSTKETVDTFAETLGITVSDEFNIELDKVTASLNASFTATQSYSSSVALSDTTTTTYKQAFAVPTGSPATALTFQVWQLVLEYGTNGNSIQQPINTFFKRGYLSE